MMISVTILTKNSARHLRKVLHALCSFDEVLLYDTGSTDDTLLVAKEFTNTKIVEGKFLGFGETHNVASSLTRYDWILSIDSDEVLSPELVEEIQNLALDPQRVYSISRKNFYNQRWIRCCSWYPDRQVKLYHRKMTQFCHAKVHERVFTDHLQIEPLHFPLSHFSYQNTSDFLAKMQSYSTLFAQQSKGKPSSVKRATLHALSAFFKSYLLKRGFMGGAEGFIISIYNANTTFYKYLKLMEVNRTPAPSDLECSSK